MMRCIIITTLVLSHEICHNPPLFASQLVYSNINVFDTFWYVNTWNFYSRHCISTLWSKAYNRFWWVYIKKIISFIFLPFTKKVLELLVPSQINGATVSLIIPILVLGWQMTNASWQTWIIIRLASNDENMATATGYQHARPQLAPDWRSLSGSEHRSQLSIAVTVITSAVSWLREEINWHVIVHNVYAYGAMSEGILNDCENVFKKIMYD